MTLLSQSGDRLEIQNVDDAAQEDVLDLNCRGVLIKEDL